MLKKIFFVWAFSFLIAIVPAVAFNAAFAPPVAAQTGASGGGGDFLKKGGETIVTWIRGVGASIGAIGVMAVAIQFIISHHFSPLGAATVIVGILIFAAAPLIASTLFAVGG